MNANGAWRRGRSWQVAYINNQMPDIIRQAITITGFPVQIYAPASATGADGNVVPSAYVLQNPSQPINAMILTDQEAEQAAMALGQEAQRTAYAYLPYTAQGMVQATGLLVDHNGAGGSARYWRIQQQPVPYEMSPSEADNQAAVVGFRMLVVQELQKPAGLP